MGELRLLYVDDSLADVTPFGTVRGRAFRIMPEEKLRSTGKLLTEAPVSKMDLCWHARQFKRMHSALRTLRMRVGRVYRDIERQLAQVSSAQLPALTELMALVKHKNAHRCAGNPV